MKNEKTYEASPIFIGDLKSFNYFIGHRLKNIIPSLTKKYKREIGKCEHCGITNIEFDAAHKHDFSRKKIIEKILSDFRVDDVKYKVDLIDFEEKYKLEHTPISKVILVLCKSCHTLYDAKKNNLKALDRLVKPDMKINNGPQPRKENNLKIGAFVRDSFRKAYKQNLITEDEIKKLQDPEYSNRIFNAGFEVLRFKSISIEDHNGNKRYYAKELFCDSYHLSSQWYEHQRDSFLNWLKDVGYSN
jgi:hypothetical protein|tara:strand:+ start:476 stop:1210 length:735 start_codon:yes stop_codon:yes gene_type:complete